MERQKDIRLFQREFIGPSAWRAVLRLSPRAMMGNPVMFVAWLGAMVTTIDAVRLAFVGGDGPVFVIVVTVFLWLTVWFANFAESLAEARGRAQADTLRAARHDVKARKLASADRHAPAQRPYR